MDPFILKYIYIYIYIYIYYGIVAGVLQGDIFAPNLFIIYLDYVFRTLIDQMKENGFTLKMPRSRRYSAGTITNANHADDIALLANTPTQTESLQHILEQAAGVIVLHVNKDKIKHMCFNQKRDISTLKDGSLKLVDKFLVFGSYISRTENDTNMQQAKP